MSSLMNIFKQFNTQYFDLKWLGTVIYIIKPILSRQTHENNLQKYHDIIIPYQSKKKIHKN